MWLKRLRKKNIISVEHLEKYQFEVEQFDYELKSEKTKEEKLFSWLSKITINCQKVLNSIFIKNTPVEKMMEMMGWKNKHTAANQQYKCIQQLKKQKESEE